MTRFNEYFPILTIVSIAIISLTSCNNSNSKVENSENSLDRVKVAAANGSNFDIEKMLRYYEECPKGMTKENCAKESEYWVRIGVALGNAGAISVMINAESEKFDCTSALDTLSMIRKIRPMIEKSNSRYKYYYENEESDAVKKIRVYCKI
ncbi:MAG: hypothetical protein ABL914_11635 [Novosphingobium sp.]|uniref:hypothetical protein n=1 Tax=Novosphingobium sp. TaxID=1874826 RepID=UPI0032BA7D63